MLNSSATSARTGENEKEQFSYHYQDRLYEKCTQKKEDTPHKETTELKGEMICPI